MTRHILPLKNCVQSQVPWICLITFPSSYQSVLKVWLNLHLIQFHLSTTVWLPLADWRWSRLGQRYDTTQHSALSLLFVLVSLLSLVNTRPCSQIIDSKLNLCFRVQCHQTVKVDCTLSLIFIINITIIYFLVSLHISAFFSVHCCNVTQTGAVRSLRELMKKKSWCSCHNQFRVMSTRWRQRYW